jgi:hypothetical protein
VIGIHYGDRGIYSDDGVNWNACNSGLPPDPGTTIARANTQGMNIDPATGYVYIVLKNGDVYRTKIASRRCKKTAVSNGTAGVSFTSAKQLF